MDIKKEGKQHKKDTRKHWLQTKRKIIQEKFQQILVGWIKPIRN